MYFDQFETTFDSPTSTTTKLQVAHIFSSNDGIIMELAKSSSLKDNTRYFNCSFVSAFPNEDERLFIQPYGLLDVLKISSIRNVSTNENYMEYIDALSTLHALIFKVFLDVKPYTLKIDNLIYSSNSFRWFV